LITPPHVALACLIGTGAEEIYKNNGSIDLGTIYASVIVINLFFHYVLDVIPHGHTLNPFDTGNNLRSFYIELAISASIILLTLFISDQPILIIVSSVASLIPDCVSTSLAKFKLPITLKKILSQIQRFHFFIHWFEKIDENGKRIVPNPSKFELISQSIFVILCIILIFLLKLK